MKRTGILLLWAVITLSFFSCQKVDDLQSQVSDLKKTQIASIQEQVTSIMETITELNKIDESLGDSVVVVKQLISNLKGYVNSTLSDQEDWVSATFATLAQMDSVYSLLAEVKVDYALEDSILSDKIDSTEQSVIRWVGKQFTGYYTIAQTDAQINTLLLQIQSDISKGDEETLSAVKKAASDADYRIDSLKTALTKEYQDAIKNAIEGDDGLISNKINTEITAVNNRITSEITTLNNSIAALADRVTRLEAEVFRKFNILFEDGLDVGILPSQKATVSYKINGSTPDTEVEAIGQGGWKAKVNALTDSTGTITITAPESITDDKILVFAFDGTNRTVMRSISLVSGVITPTLDVYEISEDGGTIDIALSTNVQYDIVIPETEKTWLSLAPVTKSLRQDVVSFSISKNEGKIRYATVKFLYKGTSIEMTSVLIRQDGLAVEISSNGVKNVLCNSATILGIADQPLTQELFMGYGFSYSLSQDFSSAHNISALGYEKTDTGYVFQADLKNLTFNTTYYYRTYVIYKNNYIYGDTASFVTEPIRVATGSASVDGIVISTKGNKYNCSGPFFKGVLFLPGYEDKTLLSKWTGSTVIQAWLGDTAVVVNNTFFLKYHMFNESVKYYYRAYLYDGEKYYYGDIKEVTTGTIDLSKLSTNPQAVDLGLPSGKLWANYNIGATKPEENGNYYAWGEIETKSEYTKENYLHYDKTYQVYTDIGNDISGDTRYDVAAAKWGNEYRMPTKRECEELLNYCKSINTTYNGKEGYLLIGPSGNIIFFPKAGFKEGDYLFNNGLATSYCLSTRYEFDDENSYLISSYQTYNLSIDASYTYRGFPVRPIKGNAKNITPTAVDLGLSVKWSNINVGAYYIEDYGDRYAWGETEENKTDYSLNTYDPKSDGFGKYDNIGSDISGTQYDVAHIKWGGSWKMPTLEQMEELRNNCTWIRITQNEVNGYKVISNINGNSIFIPFNAYWSSINESWTSINDYSFSFYLALSNSSIQRYSTLVYDGNYIRPVTE